MSGLLGFNSLLFLPLSWKVGAQLSEQMCLVRQGGGWHTAIYWIPPGTWNSSSAPPGSPAYIPGQSPLLSIRASLLPRAQGGNVANIGSSSSLCPEQPSRCTLSTTPPPRHQRPQKDLEGWRWARGAAAILNMSGGYVSSAPDLPHAGSLLSHQGKGSDSKLLPLFI